MDKSNRESMKHPQDPGLSIRCFDPADQQAVIDLWQRCDLLRPWNDPIKDISRKMADSPSDFFVGEYLINEGDDQLQLVAAAMAGYDGHRGWVNYLAVDPKLQGHGFGRDMMVHIEQSLLARGCPKINLQVRETNATVISFYKSIGYQVDAAVSLGKRLVPDLPE